MLHNGPVPLFRWDEIALEKVTEMISRKVVQGDRETLAQVYLKRGALVPLHAHPEEQMTYVLQGALQSLVAAITSAWRKARCCSCQPTSPTRSSPSTTRSC